MILFKRKKPQPIQEDFFPGFPYAAQNLSAFKICLDIAIVSLKSGEIVRFPLSEHREEFKAWLLRNRVKEVF